MVNREELKIKFGTGRVPTENDFARLIDGLGAIKDESVGKDISWSSYKMNQYIQDLKQKDAEVTAQLAQTEDTLGKKVGDGVLAEMGDLSQDVKESMTGGSVAVVGEGAVTMDTLASDVKKEIDSISNKEGYVKSNKNLFDPDKVITGQAYNNNADITFNSNFNLLDKIPFVGGSTIAISGLTEKVRTYHHSRIVIWSGENGESHLRNKAFINAPNSNEMVYTLPEEATHVSFNLNGEIPEKLQIELNDKVTEYEPYRKLEHAASRNEVESLVFKKSKNVYNHEDRINYYRLTINGTNPRATEPLSSISSVIPLEKGVTYTLSGYDLNFINHAVHHLHLFNDNFSDVTASNSPHRERTVPLGEKITTFTVGENEQYLIFPVSQQGEGGVTQSDIEDLKIQLERGDTATTWVPHRSNEYVDKQINHVNNEIKNRVKETIDEVVIPSRNASFYSDFIELNKVRNEDTTLEKMSKGLSPFGVYYSVNAQDDSGGNILYTQSDDVLSGEKSLFARMSAYHEGSTTTGTLKKTEFKIPSGTLDNEGTVTNIVNNFDYCHPSIAYSAEGVAGYKYWMISSILPGVSNDGNSTWEDEDLFVSNDGENWMRVKSLYEPDKDYHAPNVSLPPHSLVTTSARRHGFLPQPSTGTQIEVSSPADNGGDAKDRETVTLDDGFKHDPAILIDGGYVYTYHSFHMPYGDRTGGRNRYMVCVRTSDGINWEVVRTDGSTMLLTEDSSREIFTMDNQGRYNFMYYAFTRSNSNPEIIKYGENDYEMVYGYNFSFRVKGTTPYNFDFSTQYPFNSTGSGNHPGLLYDGEKLMLINNKYFMVSTDRGETFDVKPHYPTWRGGVGNLSYKKAMCLGEGGKVLLVEAHRMDAQANAQGAENQYVQTRRYHQLYIYEFNSVQELIGYSDTGLNDGYIDIQYSLVNYETGKREGGLIPYITNSSTTTTVNTPMQKIKFADLEFESGDILYIFAVLNSRNDTEIRFSGLEIS